MAEVSFHHTSTSAPPPPGERWFLHAQDVKRKEGGCPGLLQQEEEGMGTRSSALEPGRGVPHPWTGALADRVNEDTPLPDTNLFERLHYQRR